MGIFSSIKDAIFGDEDEATKSGTSAPKTTGFNRASSKGISDVSVEAKLDSKPGADKLNWRASIVDLMKLVDLDPSYENRKELATELGDTNYSGKAEENVWLHKEVMKRLAAAGGSVPASLRD